MRRWLTGAVAVAVWSGTMGLLAVVPAALEAQGPQPVRRAGWTIPETATDEKSPLTVNAAVLAAGKRLFLSKCERCHGAAGKGDGPDAEPEHMESMNLTVAARAGRNPDGTVFYKIWNGRGEPKMPAMSAELTKEQVWALVAYVQTLRAK